MRKTYSQIHLNTFISQNFFGRAYVHLTSLCGHKFKFNFSKNVGSDHARNMSIISSCQLMKHAHFNAYYKESHYIANSLITGRQ